MRMFIGGDICPTETTMNAMATGDVATAFGTVCDLVKGADRFIANLECALTRSETPILKCGPNLRALPECAMTLKKLGITDVGLANNHVYDFGRNGLADTLNALRRAGINFTGVGLNEMDARQPQYIYVGGVGIALICVCEHEYSYALKDREGCWGFDPFETIEDVAKARRNVDYVIVLYHGGKEQSRYPSPRLRKACQALVRAGADLVLCQHSHCIGVPEHYEGSLIVYGQGNFNFVKHNDNPHWQNGLLLELVFESHKPNYIFHPVVVKDHGITLAEGPEKEDILRKFYERESVLLDDEAWMGEWSAFCEGLRPQYTKAVTEAFSEGSDVPEQIFLHYLDCEAHTDVWRQLFPTWNGDNTIEDY